MSHTIQVPCSTPWHRFLWPSNVGGTIVFQSACACTNSVLPLLKPRTVWWSTLRTVHVTWRWGVDEACGEAARRLQGQRDARQTHGTSCAPSDDREAWAVSAPQPARHWPRGCRERRCREGMIAEWLEVR